MTLEERIKLINAGYTKEEIAAMEASQPMNGKQDKTPGPAPEEKKEEKTFSEILAAEIAKALSSAAKSEAKPDPQPEKKPEEKKKEEKKKEEKTESDDEVIKKLVADQLKTFFQPSMKIDPVTDLSDISKRLFEVKITKEGE